MRSCCPPGSSRLFVAALLVALGTAGAAAAQPTVSVRGNVGASFFRAPELTRQILHSGSNVGVEAGLRLYRGLAVTVGADYYSFTLNEDNARLYRAGGGDLAFLGGGLGLRYTLANSTDAHPYAAIGGGIYQVRVTNRQRVTTGGTLEPIEGTRTAVEEGMHLALGSLFRIDDTYAVFVEPRYMFFDLNGDAGEATRSFVLRLGMDVQL
jgi:hypothetical protein